ncbi:SIMPL domain-containing protein [Erythrobacter sp. THAF29]|uniref:SIMPL domain-containing protein n=1 Tax=Erythrobacter sp. THAF29 TaxID=2587851 RepID=UPI0012678668|nr:SIMPL domain-containing protein [Erythrobacter sp. THAF29]QFT77393.1 26 kDa periplasmic immunogenic protein precursor [Erythrobacter sp. THAF29]
MKHIIFAPLVATAITLSPTALHAATVEIETEGPVIELSIFETIKAEPDIATIGAGVTTEARTAVEAMQMNATQMRKVIDRLKSLGIDEKDIQTSGINLNARYDYNRTDNRPVFRGYQVSNRVSVILRDIEEVGRTLDELVAAGATDLSGPNFSIEDDASAKDTARKRAIERGQARAQDYASMLGYDSVRVLEISEAVTGRGPMPQMAARDVAEQSIVLTASPVQPGQVSTGVQIRITYEMVQGSTES